MSVDTRDIISLKAPPYSVEHEKSLLATCLLDSEEAFKISGSISPEDFYKSANQELFKAIKESLKKTDTIDYATITEHFKEFTYTAEIMNNHPVCVNVNYTIKKIKDLALKRYLISSFNDKINEIYESTSSGKELTDKTIQEFMELEIKDSGSPVHIKETMVYIREDLEKIKNGETPYQGLMTGFHNIDKSINGLQKQDFIILAARPSMGKTALAMNIATNITRDYNIPVLIFSLEMSKNQLTFRASCSEARVNSTVLKAGIPTNKEIGRFEDSLSMVESYPIYTDDTGNQSLSDIRRKSFEMKKKHNIGLIVIDYIQLMKLGKADRQDIAIGDVSKGLKGIAKSLDLPVIALSQLNRNLEQRTNKRPVMSDLRESGALEQDADIIMFIYRDEVYNKDPNNPHKGKAEIIIAKNRNGPIDTKYLTWIGKYTRFENFINEAHI